MRSFACKGKRSPSPPMKQHHSPRGGSLMTGIFACLLSISSAFAADAVPTGTLSVDRNMIRVGSRSQLTWDIQHPAGVTEVIDVVTPSIIKPKQDLKMRVRVLGASFQETITSFLPVEVMWKKNSGSWTRVFYGNQLLVNPSAVVLNTTVKKNDLISFGGRGFRDGSWLSLFNTGTASQNVVLLKNGDRVPTTVPALNGGNIESFLKPYLLADKKTVSIGNRDVILLMELGQTNVNNSGFDLQDLVVLVTFE